MVYDFDILGVDNEVDSEDSGGVGFMHFGVAQTGDGPPWMRFKGRLYNCETVRI